MTLSKHAIVTGGSSGIGKAVAKMLAARGAAVTIMARRPDVLKAAAAEIETAGGAGARILAIPVDVSDRAAVNAAIGRAEAELGPCDLLVTSAGIAHPGYFSDLPDAIFDQTMAINYFGTLHPIRAVAPGMRQRKGGRIVLISSGAGIVGIFGYSAYSPSKFALRGLAEVLRAELSSDGIAVSIVYPPDTDTPQLEEENRIKPAETRAIAGGARILSAEQVASDIVSGVEKGKFIIAPGWEMALLYRLHSLVQPLLNWHFDGVARRNRR
jgi:3-dehydrosphinganine reductase